MERTTYFWAVATYEYEVIVNGEKKKVMVHKPVRLHDQCHLKYQIVDTDCIILTATKKKAEELAEMWNKGLKQTRCYALDYHIEDFVDEIPAELLK